MKGCIFSMLIIAPLNVFCQSTQAPLYGGAEAYLHYGISFIDASSFNKSLSHYDLPALSSPQTSVGAGGGVFLRKFYFGGEGGIQFGGTEGNDLYRSNFYSGFGMVKGGYKLVSSSSMVAYPVVGLGGGGSSITIREGLNYSEDRARLSPGSSIHAGYMLADLAVNIDFFVGAAEKDGRIVIGISPGYRFHPLKSSWAHDDQEVSDLSKFAPTGFYLRAKFGWVFRDSDKM